MLLARVERCHLVDRSEVAFVPSGWQRLREHAGVHGEDPRVVVVDEIAEQPVVLVGQCAEANVERAIGQRREGRLPRAAFASGPRPG